MGSSIIYQIIFDFLPIRRERFSTLASPKGIWHTQTDKQTNRKALRRRDLTGQQGVSVKINKTLISFVEVSKMSIFLRPTAGYPFIKPCTIKTVWYHSIALWLSFLQPTALTAISLSWTSDPLNPAPFDLLTPISGSSPAAPQSLAQPGGHGFPCPSPS